MNISKRIYYKIISILQTFWLSYPKKVQCNACSWSGRRFSSDSWHKNVNCPKCHSGIRQRLFIAALQNLENFSLDNIILNKNVLHFAPEKIISSYIQNKTSLYSTADLFRKDCELSLDLSNMPEIENESYNIVIAFDVLEHVPDYKKALDEIYRVLTPNGLGIFTIPQKDSLLETYEDPKIITPEDRIKHFGQWDHLRIFGDDFNNLVESRGFDVFTVNESMFSKNIVKLNVLFPEILSKHPLATNYRKVYFCKKV